MHDLPSFISEKDVGLFPKNKILIICTGSQGEPRAALSRITNGIHKEEIKNKGIQEVAKEYEAVVNFIQSDLKW